MSGEARFFVILPPSASPVAEASEARDSAKMRAHR